MSSHFGMSLQLILLCVTNSIQRIDGFAPAPRFSVSATRTAPTTTTSYKHGEICPPSTSSSSSSTQLNYGVIVPVPDDFFTIGGISLGIAYTLTRSWNRVVVENVAWENRLEDTRAAKLEDEDGDFSRGGGGGVNTYTELDLRKMDAAASRSSYGPEATERREGTRRRRVRTMEYDDEDEFDMDDRRSSDRVYSMTDEQIAEFEDTYGIAYDPYYDEAYREDELPDDMSFVEDKVYGDRRYENGEIFYRDENNKSVYWRQGGRPRLKQFWELF